MEQDIEEHAGLAADAALNHEAALETKRLTIDIPKQLHRFLKVRAAERELTMAGLVRSLIAEWVGNERRGNGENGAHSASQQQAPRRIPAQR